MRQTFVTEPVAIRAILAHLDRRGVDALRRTVIVRPLWSSPAAHGGIEVRFDSRGLAGGVYFLVARQASTIASRRVVVLK